MTAPFAVRGVIEGFYGNPWTQAERLDMIRFIGARGMNTFVYGPKDDPLVRRRWRDTYDGEALDRLRQVVTVGAEAAVDIVYAISPGLSIRYASPDDLDALVAKLEQVAALGVTRFGLLLDDIPPQLRHAEDLAAFTGIAEAHAHLANALAGRLGPHRSLMVCPLVYHGRGDEPYVVALGAALHPAIDLLWTGREICSRTLETEDARRFQQATGRPPLYWDNYPVNDVAMGWSLHIGPYRGRDADLHEVARGILANPMELAEASRIPLATIADYLADPAGYDPAASVAAAIRAIAGDGSPDGGADARAFATFAENAWSSVLEEDEAPTVAAALAEFAARVDDAREAGDPGAERAAGLDLEMVAADVREATSHLLGGTARNAALVEECRPWIEAVDLGARAMLHAASLAQEGRLAARATHELVPWLAALRDRRVRVFGDALDMFLADLTVTYTRPGRILRAQGGGSS